MAFWQWSKTSTANATADPTISWAEGMPPSAVDDSARAVMARAAEWRDDISGTITTAGSSTAYTVASNQVFDSFAHMHNAMVAFVPHTTSGATVTLNVDGLGAKPLRSAPTIELPSGVMAQGTPYVATYNNTDGSWYLQGFFGNPYSIPIGGLMPFVSVTPPNSSFVNMLGQAISRTTYATLFAMTGTTFGVGDGSTTFNIPDLRGRAVFGLDNGGAGRITPGGGNFDGNTLGNAGGGQNQTLTTAQLPAHTHGYSGTTGGGTTGGGTTGTGTTGTAAATGFNSVDHTHGAPSGMADFIGIPGSVTGAVSAGGGFNINTAASTAGASASHTHTVPSLSVPSLSVPGLAVPGLAYSGNTDGGTGGGTAHPILPPAMVLPYILRII